MTNPGTTPLVTISASESNCTPSGPVTPNFRAKKPSKKSKKIPRHTKKNAEPKSKLETKTIATQPLNKFNIVNKLGICALIFILTKFF